jgi:REP element-mobilizing transposase RayT
MVRGVDRLPIFYDDADRDEFVRRLTKLLPELAFRCFAWVLMPNHVHLVLRSAEARTSLLMARLGTGYARYFNERHDRVGHVFQNRFRSRRVVDDADLAGLVVYVAQNPLEAGLAADADDLEHFRWGGLGALLGRRTAQEFEAVAETLALFDGDPVRARRSVRRRLAAKEPGQIPALDPLAARTTPKSPAKGGFEAMLRAVCSGSGLSPAELRSRSRSPRLAAARASVAARAARELGLSGAEIARLLCLSRQGVSALLARDLVATAQSGRLDERPR